MYDTASVPQNMPFPANTKKITPGPYRATKLWNEIIQLFSQGMPRRRHRRHLKLYNDCFTASEAIDFLHVLLKQNHNIGNEVTRMQVHKNLIIFFFTSWFPFLHINVLSEINIYISNITRT